MKTQKTISLILTGAILTGAAALLGGCGKKYESDSFGTLKWPDSKLADILPEPESKTGKVVTDNSDFLEIRVGKTTEDQYESYVSSCKEKGFRENYDSGIGLFDCSYYQADNGHGCRLRLEYHADDDTDYRPLKQTMTIELSVLEETEPETEKPTEKPAEKPAESSREEKKAEESSGSEEKNDDTGAVSADFKETMDSYEAFFDEYIEFMQKYKEDPSDLMLLSEYTDFLSKYTEYMGKLSAIDKEELSTADALYYAEVSARISKKLTDAAL